MISDMSWLISAWKAKVSTSSSAIVSVLVWGKLRQGLRGLSLKAVCCGERRRPGDERALLDLLHLATQANEAKRSRRRLG